MESISGEPRGILHFKAGELKFQLSRHQPAADLSSFIERYWIVSWDLRGQDPYVQETLPYPCVNVVFEKNQSRVFGIEEGKFTRLLENNGQVFGVKFKPGGFYPFVKSPISQFTNTSIDFCAIFGIDCAYLEEAILSKNDAGEMIKQAETFFRARLPEQDENVLAINKIVDCIIAQRAITKVDDIVAHLAINKRKLQRLFKQYVGVSPKWVIKRYRLHEVAERLATSTVVDWPKIVLELGYSDQAHFIKDFKTIVGKTPAEYAKHVGVEILPASFSTNLAKQL